MPNRIGIRREDKNEWERRVALTPGDVAQLTALGAEIWIERSPRRVFSDEAYRAAGAILVQDVRPCELVLGIKEIPKRYFRPGGAYMFFSHTIKGQPYNMEMLAALLERECTLLDYELVTREKGRRLVFFGRFAGIAGMIDTLSTLGRRLAVLGYDTPFLDLEPAHRYQDLDEAKAAVARVDKRLRAERVPDDLAPMVFGFTGYGNVSQGAQEIFDLLPHVEVAPSELLEFVAQNGSSTDRLAKVVYREEHLVERIDPSKPFDLEEYYAQPEHYRSIFAPHLELLSVLVNGIYWDERYPKLADADHLERLFAGPERPRLVVVGDLTCDVDGSLACTVRDTEPGDPVYVYDPETGRATSGFEGPGLAVLAVGNLPCELPREASAAFSSALRPFIPALARVDLTVPFKEADLPDPLRRSVILWQGEFAPDFAYMYDVLS